MWRVYRGIKGYEGVLGGYVEDMQLGLDKNVIEWIRVKAP